VRNAYQQNGKQTNDIYTSLESGLMQWHDGTGKIKSGNK
jgi:hypothetical protein